MTSRMQADVGDLVMTPINQQMEVVGFTRDGLEVITLYWGRWEKDQLQPQVSLWRPQQLIVQRRAKEFENANFQITGLTARDVFAIYAALEVACDDECEPYPGLNDAHAKVEKVVNELRGIGHEPVDEREVHVEPDDEISCPVGDPSCEGRDDQCHDACEAPVNE